MNRCILQKIKNDVKKYYYNNNYKGDFVQYLLKDVGDDDTYYPY